MTHLRTFHYILLPDKFSNLIKARIEDNFILITYFAVSWSENYFENNLFRLNSEYSGGYKQLICYVFADNNPDIGLMYTQNRRLKVGNRNILRNFEKSSKEVIKFSVNEQELLCDLSLITDCSFNKFDLLNSTQFFKDHYRKDLEGSIGWSSFEHLFKTIRYYSSYVVLRGFDEIINGENVDDIDWLVQNFKDFSLLINMSASKLKPFKGTITVNGDLIPTDVRFIGDGYYDSNWQKNILKNRIKKEFIYIPNIKDYFYSLLYHVHIHKRGVVQKYNFELSEKLKELKIYNLNYDSKNMLDANFKNNLLIDFMKLNEYTQPASIDKSVHRDRNKKKFKLINKKLSPYRYTNYQMTIIMFLSKILPKFLKNKVKKMIL